MIVNKGLILKFILENINKEIDCMNIIVVLDILLKCIINLNYCEKVMEEFLLVIFFFEFLIKIDYIFVYFEVNR